MEKRKTSLYLSVSVEIDKGSKLRGLSSLKPVSVQSVQTTHTGAQRSLRQTGILQGYLSKLIVWMARMELSGVRSRVVHIRH